VYARTTRAKIRVNGDMRFMKKPMKSSISPIVLRRAASGVPVVDLFSKVLTLSLLILIIIT